MIRGRQVSSPRKSEPGFALRVIHVTCSRDGGRNPEIRSWKGRDLSLVSAFEAVGSYHAGSMTREDFEGIEQHASPGSDSCGGMYTANTMSASFEPLGMSLLRSSTMTNEDSEKRESAARSAEAVKLDLKPRDIITRKSIDPNSAELL